MADYGDLPEEPEGYFWEEKTHSEGDWELWYSPSDGQDQDYLYLGWLTERDGKVHWYWNFRHEVYDNWKDAMLTTITRHKFGGLEDQGRKVF